MEIKWITERNRDFIVEQWGYRTCVRGADGIIWGLALLNSESECKPLCHIVRKSLAFWIDICSPK